MSVQQEKNFLVETKTNSEENKACDKCYKHQQRVSTAALHGDKLPKLSLQLQQNHSVPLSSGE